MKILGLTSLVKILGETDSKSRGQKYLHGRVASALDLESWSHGFESP